MTTTGFERARSAEAKNMRQAAILDAAARLAAERSVREITLTEIAAAVGMHKSTMTRYFETREEIFLRLSSAAWEDWSQAVRVRLVELAAHVGTAPAGERAAAVADVLAETLVARPLFCDLLAQTPINLERGVSLEAVRGYKVQAIAASRSVAAAVLDVVPLSQDEAGNVVAAATALAGAFWQMAAPGTELRRFYEQTPELAHAVVDVGPRLAGLLTATLRGYAQ
ncbi:TetR family transcriptional regulator [Streptomyces sp. NPDC047002]|uniref:TetR family transcriptional regulator n=1 Tax=Streptomyces sp. NPDC047002 TaxID=3155475 RepID=UPI0034552DE7